MYQKRTIRKSPDSETRAMMRASNEIKIGLRRLKRTIETRQAVGKWLSQQREVRRAGASCYGPGKLLRQVSDKLPIIDLIGH